MSRILVIEPLEPLALSRTFIGGRDVFSHATALPIPLQTTVIGALGASLGIRIASQSSVDALAMLVDEIRNRCRCREPLVLGPIVEFDKLHGKYTLIGDTFVPLERLDELLVAKGDQVFIRKDLCLAMSCIRMYSIVSVGIALERRGVSEEKVVKPGYTYRYAIVRYRTADGKEVRPRFLYLVNCEELDLDVVARVGGEGRIARLYTTAISSRDYDVWERITSPLNITDAGIYIAINYVPMIPLKEEIQFERCSANATVSGLEFADCIEGYVTAPNRVPHIRVERLALGYSEVAKARRPQIVALPPGTVIRVSKGRKVKNTLMLTRYLWNIGFTTLLFFKKLGS